MWLQGGQLKFRLAGAMGKLTTTRVVENVADNNWTSQLNIWTFSMCTLSPEQAAYTRCVYTYVFIILRRWFAYECHQLFTQCLLSYDRTEIYNVDRWQSLVRSYINVRPYLSTFT
jgi:hypothetical protein